MSGLFYVALIAAGPNAIRRSGPNQKHAFVIRLDPNGFSRSSARPILHYITLTLPNSQIQLISYVLFCWNVCGVSIGSAISEQGPDDAGVLIGQRHSRNLGWFVGYDVGKPW